MPIQKTKLSESEVSIELDLEKLLGGAANNRVVRETFFQLAYDKMIERLDSGIGADGKRLPAYSKGYKDSLEYSVYGKDGTVNMQLTGGMIADLEILKQDSSKMKVGFSSNESVKAYAHMTGFKGHPSLDGKVKPRNFFGWKDEELVSIANELKPKNTTKQTFSDERLLSLIDRLLA